jgi:hypothetical protein
MSRLAALLPLAVALLTAPLGARADLGWDPANPPVSDDPAAEALADNRAGCAGEATVEPGFLRQLDVDGDGVNDAVLNWGGLRCDGSTSYCGSGGCRQDIWLATLEGRWRLLLRDRIGEVHVPVPGAVVLRLDPEDCEPVNSRVCFQAFDAWGGTLRPLVPGGEPWQP